MLEFNTNFLGIALRQYSYRLLKMRGYHKKQMNFCAHLDIYCISEENKCIPDDCKWKEKVGMLYKLDEQGN